MNSAFYFIAQMPDKKRLDKKNKVTFNVYDVTNW